MLTDTATRPTIDIHSIGSIREISFVFVAITTAVGAADGAGSGFWTSGAVGEGGGCGGDGGVLRLGRGRRGGGC